jgi:CRP-like cAMP-binding protein
MPFDPLDFAGNQLLDAMPMAELEALAPSLDWVEFAMRDVISEPDKPMNFAYFPFEGVFSTISMVEVEDQVEMGLIGREGFLGASILLGAEHDPFRVIAQAPGRALRLPAARLIEASLGPDVRTVLLRFIHTFMVQAASTILANSSYLVEERLARWILMTQDRLATAIFPMTHDFMALMLAVRRAGVTEAVHRLEGRHLVKATRGQMHVLDRQGLEALASGCYGQAEHEHRRLFGPVGRPASQESAGN